MDIQVKTLDIGIYESEVNELLTVEYELRCLNGLLLCPSPTVASRPRAIASVPHKLDDLPP
jgi:hypothetical protein